MIITVIVAVFCHIAALFGRRSLTYPPVACEVCNGPQSGRIRKQEKTMRRAIFAAFAASVLGAVPGCESAEGGPRGYYEVAGVEADDMLKMRAGPGTGFRVIVGLPNGSILRVYSCERTGGTRWCKASSKQSPGLKGYVSWAYLRKI